MNSYNNTIMDTLGFMNKHLNIAYGTSLHIDWTLTEGGYLILLV